MKGLWSQSEASEGLVSSGEAKQEGVLVLSLHSVWISLSRLGSEWHAQSQRVNERTEEVNRVQLNLSETGNWVCGWALSHSTVTHLSFMSSLSFKKSWVSLPASSLTEVFWGGEQAQPSAHFSMAWVCSQLAVRKLKSEAYIPVIKILWWWLDLLDTCDFEHHHHFCIRWVEGM